MLYSYQYLNNSVLIRNIKDIVIKKYQLTPENVSDHFADTRDTLCYATNDNQTAVRFLLENQADLAIVIGGRKSSNSSHLVELCEHKLPTYFIESEEDILSVDDIKGFNWQTHKEYIKHKYLPTKEKTRMLITSGASCPDAIVETVIEKIISFFPDAKSIEEIKRNWK
jgi:4-hydroxy-3-methylbut-2-enyl diphosphate reductase